MKSNIHPQYHEKIQAICACGASFETGSTMPELKIDICSSCHPFYSGKQKLLDTAGRVEKFAERAKKAAGDSLKSKKEKQAIRNAKKAQE